MAMCVLSVLGSNIMHDVVGLLCTPLPTYPPTTNRFPFLSTIALADTTLIGMCGMSCHRLSLMSHLAALLYVAGPQCRPSMSTSTSLRPCSGVIIITQSRDAATVTPLRTIHAAQSSSCVTTCPKLSLRCDTKVYCEIGNRGHMDKGRDSQSTDDHVSVAQLSCSAGSSA